MPDTDKVDQLGARAKEAVDKLTAEIRKQLAKVEAAARPKPKAKAKRGRRPRG